MDWILWVDIETTGLDAQNDHILQIACVLTDFENTVHYKQEFTIGYDVQTLQRVMSEWCKKQHAESGLSERVLNSTFQLKDAEKQIILCINQHLKVRDTVYIAGNSVHFDKKFIDHHMPLLSTRLSHRIIDISTISILCKNLAPEIYKGRPVKEHNHTAIQDIVETVQEYTYYKTTFMRYTDTQLHSTLEGLEPKKTEF